MLGLGLGVVFPRNELWPVPNIYDLSIQSLNLDHQNSCYRADSSNFQMKRPLIIHVLLIPSGEETMTKEEYTKMKQELEA